VRYTFEKTRPEVFRIIGYCREIDDQTGKPRCSFQQVADILNGLGFEGQNGQSFERRAIHSLLKAAKNRTEDEVVIHKAVIHKAVMKKVIGFILLVSNLESEAVSRNKVINRLLTELKESRSGERKLQTKLNNIYKSKRWQRGKYAK